MSTEKQVCFFLYCVVIHLFAHKAERLPDAGAAGELGVETRHVLRQDRLEVVQQDLPVGHRHRHRRHSDDQFLME